MAMTVDTREALADAATEFTNLTGCKWEVYNDPLIGPEVVDWKHNQGIPLMYIKAALTGKLKRFRQGDTVLANFTDEPIGIVAWHKWGVEHL